MEAFKTHPTFRRRTDFGFNVPFRDIQVHKSLIPRLFADVYKYNSIFRFAAAAAAAANDGDAATVVIAATAAILSVVALKIRDSDAATILPLYRSYYSNIEIPRTCNRARRKLRKNIKKTELYDASIQTDCIMDFSRHRDGVEVMTQTNVVMDIDKTAVCDISTQTDCPDFLNVHRGEPDGSSIDSMTHVKTVFGTDQPDSDTTYVKEAYTASCNFDSLDVLTFSHADSSLDDIDNNLKESEIWNADKCSSGDEHNNGTECTNLLDISDVSFDSDELFGD